MSAPLTSLPPSAFDVSFEPPKDDLTSSFPLDFLSFTSPSDILAPHPDLFESELDNTFAQLEDTDLQLQLLAVDSNDAFAFLRSDTPTHQYRNGPRSTVTVSSESASGYDSLSSYSESFYNPASPALGSSYSFPLDLDMEFQRVHVDPLASYASIKRSPDLGGISLSNERASFGVLPSSPHNQHPSPGSVDMYRPRSGGRAYSDYMPSQGVVRSSAASDYYPQLGNSRHPSLAGMQQPRTVSPSRVSPSSNSDMSNMSVPITPPLPLVPMLRESPEDDNGDDPRKKYKCPNCPRSFARAFNLKTHMSTHDPNRPKPHVCPHASCGRSFSRKHDLGRHLVSIHRDEQGMAHAGTGIAAGQSARSERGVGVEKGPRAWCDKCGKGWVGSTRSCRCNDIK